MTMVCFVLFSDAPDFQKEAFRDKLEKCPLPALELLDIGQQDPSIHTLEFRSNGQGSSDSPTVFVSQMPAFPFEQSESETSGPLWPNSLEELGNNQSHWIVTTAGSDLPPIEAATLLTQVTDAILKSHPTAVGVLWNKHGLQISSKHFQQILATTPPDDLPLDLWIDITVIPAPDDDSPMVALTTGMDGFDLMEVECIGSPEPPDELHARISGVCQYLIQNGPVLLHGHTIGESDDERITVLHAKSAFGRDGDVLHLRYGDPETQQAAIPSNSPADKGWKSVLALLGIMAATGVLLFGIVTIVRWITAGDRGVATAPAKTASRVAAEPSKVAARQNTPQASPAEPDTTLGQAATTDATSNGAISPPVKTEEPASSKASPPKAEFKADEWDPYRREWRDSSGSSQAVGDIIAVERDQGETVVRVRTLDGDIESIPYKTLEQDQQPVARQWYEREQTRPVSADGSKLPLVNDRVKLKWGSKWWNGHVVEAEEDRYKVAYDGWSSSWDEWKTPAELRWPDDTPIAAAEESAP